MAKALDVDWEQEDKIPFDAANRRFLEAYFQYLHHPNEARGVDFWWLDWQQGSRSSDPRVNTLLVLNHQHFLDNGRNGTHRPLILSRYSGIGSHRYPVGFSGDTFATWASLDFQPYFTVTAGNVGYGWWSHDIGGHQGGRRDDELTVRWLQFGVFSPILRLHSTSNPFYGKEPWNYSPEAQTIMTAFLRLRSRLIPYLYTMNWLSHAEGLPLLRPMYYHHDVPEAYEVPNEYYFGTEMLACPITRPADPETRLAAFDAWLPEGEYIDFFTGWRYRGGRRLRLYRSLETIPVLLPAGSILPLAGDFMEDAGRNPEELELQVFHGAEGAFTMYEDGGEAETGAGPAVVRTVFRYRSGETSELVLRTEGEREGVLPDERRYTVRIRGITPPQAVEMEGVPFSQDYDVDRKELRVRFSWDGRTEQRLILRTETVDAAAPDPLEAVHGILHRARISYDLKARLYRLICEARSLEWLIGELHMESLPKSLEGALLEQLSAREVGLFWI